MTAPLMAHYLLLAAHLEDEAQADKVACTYSGYFFSIFQETL